MSVADFVLRDLDGELKEKLRQRAARRKRSLNAELREIVRVALTRPQACGPAEFRTPAPGVRAVGADRAQTTLRQRRSER